MATVVGVDEEGYTLEDFHTETERDEFGRLVVKVRCFHVTPSELVKYRVVRWPEPATALRAA